MTPRDFLKTSIARGTAIFGGIALCAMVIAAQGQDPHPGNPGTTGSPTPADPSIQTSGHDADLLARDAFAKTYVTEMVNGHRDALQLLDDAIKTAQNDQVRAHLIAVRQTVAMHLRSAEALQTAAGQEKSPEPDPGPDERAQFVTAL
jgi:hypothetical protein